MPTRIGAKWFLGLAAGLSFSTGCDPADVAIHSATHVEPGRSVRGDDHYIGIRGKKKTATGTAYMQSPPEVWAPFDVSIHMGLFDPDRKSTAQGTVQCLQVDNVGFSIAFRLCAAYDAPSGNWAVAAYDLNVQIGSTIAVAGDEFELRTAEASGTLSFYARPFGSNTWQDVASMAYPTITEPLHASFGVFNLAKGTEVGFDDPSLTTSPPGDTPSAERNAAGSANAALLSGLQAYLALDGSSPDFAAAATAIGNALTALGNAQTQVIGLPSSKVRDKALGSFKRCLGRLGDANGDVTDQDARRALKGLEKAARQCAPGILALVPQPPTHFPP